MDEFETKYVDNVIPVEKCPTPLPNDDTFMAKSFKVLGARCIVKEQKNESQVSGIYIQGRDKEQTNHGTVLVIGDGAILEDGRRVPMSVQPGDHVLYSAFSGAPIKVKKDDDERYLILNERDIYCIYNPQ